MRRWIGIVAALIVSMLLTGSPAMGKQNVAVEVFYNGVWNDHTADLYRRSSITINRAAGSEQTGVVPTDGTLTFQTRDGRLNPDNVKSPLYGLIGEKTPIRVKVDGDIRLSGRAVKWSPRRSLGGQKFDAWEVVTIADKVRELGQGDQPTRSALRRFYDLANPTAFWALDQGQLATAVALTSGTGGPFEVIQGSSILGSGTVTPWIGTGLAMSQRDVTSIVSATVTAKPTLAMVLDATFSWDPNGADSSIEFTIGPDMRPGGSPRWAMTLFGDGILTYGSQNGSIASSVVNPGGLHYVRMEIAASGSDTVLTPIVDGVARPAFTDSGNALSGKQFNRVVMDYADSTTTPRPIVLSSVALFVDASVPSASDVYLAVLGYPGELAGDRFIRICDQEGIASTVVGDPAETQPMGPQHADTVLKNLEEIAKTDAGLIFGTRSQEGLTLRTGRSLYNQ